MKLTMGSNGSQKFPAVRWGVFLALSVFASLLSLAQVYTLKRINIPPLDKQKGTLAVNDAGQVIVSRSGPGQSWLLNPDGTYDMLPPYNGGTYSLALAVNELGVVAGVARDANEHQVGMIWSRAGGLKILPEIPNTLQTFVTGINELGQVIGAFDQPTGGALAYIYSVEHGLALLSAPTGFTNIGGHDINNFGVATFSAYSPILGDRAFRWTNETGFVDIGKPVNALTMNSQYINGDGTIMSASIMDAGYNSVSYTELGGQPIDVKSADDGQGQFPTGLNDHGDMTVYQSDGSGSFRGALWRYGWPKFRLIGTMLDSSGALAKVGALGGINNKGTVVGTGWYDGAKTPEPFMMTPHSYDLPPATLNLTLGKVVHGTLDSLKAKDGDTFAVRRFLVPSLSSPSVSFTVSAKTAPDTVYLWLKLTAKSSATATMRVSLWDVKAGAWDKKYPLSTALGPQNSYSECIAKRRLEWYMSPESTVRAKIEVWPTAFDPSFTAEFDQASFEYVPESG